VSAGDLLLEGSGTNLLTHSQEFNNATSWTLRNVSTGLLPVVTANAAIAPDGTLTADRIVFNLSSAGRSDIYHNTFSTAGVQNTTSIWLKSATGTNQTIYLRTQGNVVTITVTPTWQRFSGGGVTSDQIQFGLRDIYTGPVTSADIYAWGAQLEANSYPTSYIPTSGSTATRAADVSTSATTFGNSWYEQSEGTVYHLYNPFGVGSSRFYSFNDGTANNQILGAASNGSGSASNYIEITAASVNQGFLGASGAYSPTLQTGALAYIVNNCAYSKNGGAVLVDTSVTIPTVNTLNLGSAHSNSAILNGTIRRLTYWPTRLSNDTLQTITV